MDYRSEMGSITLHPASLVQKRRDWHGASENLESSRERYVAAMRYIEEHWARPPVAPRPL